MTVSTSITPEILAKKDQLVNMFRDRLRTEDLGEATLHNAIGRGTALTDDFIATIRQAPVSKRPMASLINRTSTSTLAGYDKFVTSERFKKDTSASAELPIGYLSYKFQKQFLGLVETSIPEMLAVVSRLQQQSMDDPIRRELGANHQLPIGQFFYFLKTADRSKWHICYAVGKDGQTWAVRAFWNDGGWSFHAYSVADKGPWGWGNHIVSRGSDSLAS